MFDMYTVKNNNFFDFGVNAGDNQLEMFLDGSSPLINLSTPIQFYGSPQRTLYVSQQWCVHLSNYQWAVQHVKYTFLTGSDKFQMITS